MDILDNTGLGAAIIVVDIDQMSDEIRRLRGKSGTPAEDRSDQVESIDSQANGEDSEEAAPQARYSIGPVHRPSWSGVLEAPVRGVRIDEVQRFRCGR